MMPALLGGGFRCSPKASPATLRKQCLGGPDGVEMITLSGSQLPSPAGQVLDGAAKWTLDAESARSVAI
jgi:hypothetical protein